MSKHNWNDYDALSVTYEVIDYDPYSVAVFEAKATADVFYFLQEYKVTSPLHPQNTFADLLDRGLKSA